MITPRRAFILSLVCWLLVWLDTLTPAPPVVRADFGATAVVITIIGSIASWFRRSGSGASADVMRSLRGLRDALSGLAGQLVNFIGQAGQVFARIAGALKRFWREIVRPFLLKIDEWIRRGFKWLRDTFGPILEFLRAVRRKFLEFYTKWLRPIFDTIDAVRRVLGLLGRFGVTWARELDAKLAELEEQLLRPIRFALQKINEVIDVIDRVITLDGLLQRYTMFRTAVRDIGAIAAIWHNAHSKPVTDADRDAARARDSYKGGDQILNEAREYILTSDGPDRASIEEAFADLVLRVGSGP